MSSTRKLLGDNAEPSDVPQMQALKEPAKLTAGSVRGESPRIMNDIKELSNRDINPHPVDSIFEDTK